MNLLNPATLLDSYKLGHRIQYPDGTQEVYSNWTPRSSRIEGVNEVVFVGLQYFLQQYMTDLWNEQFFSQPLDKVIAEYKADAAGFTDENDVKHLEDLHALGYLPLEFSALPEGSLVPLRVPMLTVRNTHPDFAWLVNYMESLMSAVLWVPSTSATIAKRVRVLLEDAAERTGSPFELVDWQGHDFSMRGMGGIEAGILSGIGHLTQFTGTDSVPAARAVRNFYGVEPGSIIGGSVPATEHSVMCAGGKDDELETYRRLLRLYPNGILSVVSDTWDLWKVLTETLPTLKDEIMARDGKLVIRPDSGNPADIVCGLPGSYADGQKTPEEKGVVELLWDLFGGTVNEAGYKVLDPHIGVIYGDAMNYERIKEILSRLEAKGFASSNMVFGMGSFGYQYQTRDTFGFAMKATSVTINGIETAIFKQPVTDDGTKNSLTGKIAVMYDEVGERFYALDNATPAQLSKSLLTPVWADGHFIHKTKFDDVRARARA